MNQFTKIALLLCVVLVLFTGVFGVTNAIEESSNDGTHGYAQHLDEETNKKIEKAIIILSRLDREKLIIVKNRIQKLNIKYEGNEKIKRILEELLIETLLLGLLKDPIDIIKEGKIDFSGNNDVGNTYSCTLQGDANLDGEINKSDIKYLSGVITQNQAESICSDVNKDGKITVPDIVMISSIISATDGANNLTVDLSDERGRYEISQEGGVCEKENVFTNECSCPEDYESTAGISFVIGPEMYVCYKSLY